MEGKNINLLLVEGGYANSYPLMNYDYLLHETQYVGDFGRRDLVICDETHNIESKLMHFIGFKIGENELESVGVRERPRPDAAPSVWKNTSTSGGTCSRSASRAWRKGCTPSPR